MVYGIWYMVYGVWNLAKPRLNDTVGQGSHEHL